MEYTCGPMTIADYDEMYALWRSIPGIGLNASDSRENINAYLARNPGQSFVCRLGGKLVGTILCGSDGRRAYIHHTAVSPDHRGRGAASALLKRALEAQKKLGILKCHLFIFNTNETGRGFNRWTAIRVIYGNAGRRGGLITVTPTVRGTVREIYGSVVYTSDIRKDRKRPGLSKHHKKRPDFETISAIFRAGAPKSGILESPHCFVNE
jgi:GNAT superfamily N-acetyltransferase